MMSVVRVSLSRSVISSVCLTRPPECRFPRLGTSTRITNRSKAAIRDILTTHVPDLKIPAFCWAILSTVSPNKGTWSRPNEVTPTAAGERNTLVESKVPPMPTSTTAVSTCSSTKTERARTVRNWRNLKQSEMKFVFLSYQKETVLMQVQGR